MNPSQIYKHIIQKSKKTYYRMILIMSLILLIISSYSFFYMFNQSSNNDNFYNNSNAHIIRIEGKMNNNTLNKLNHEDVEQIKDVLNERGQSYKLSQIFKLSSGIMDASDNKGMILYGLDDNFPEMVNRPFQMKSDVLYSDTASKELKMIIPHIQFTEQGDVQSNSTEVKTYQIGNIYDMIDASDMTYFFSRKIHDLPMMFTSQVTLEGILDIMFMDKKKGDHVEETSIYKYIDVEEVLLYVDDIGALGDLVGQYRESNFLVSYAFDSFESFSEDLWKSNILYNIILVIMIIISTMYILLTYRNYLKSQQKDIGVFKIFGYSNQSIKKIYSQVLFKLFGTVFTVAFIFNIIICFNRWDAFILVFAIESIMLLFIIWFIIQYQIKSIINKGVLFLVKDDKEFE
ncbi:hypothetical protein HUB98_19610 [Paenibacillus barcinonensis]|uniref:FtsX-like permease family protein n=1 Tax=Paenibacillus barcinonensis TaxID=198119 RepID=A0A2V4WIH1_PAEBA|nr:hypothetical protein [Paenibacillus barcinonensis]PYE47334.1 hypothetical protein DFQ00_11474 [Paenibacillus barcinonensis]QKS58231.1 hypothetical protein HUB98_19610 [Paenibacillus barcinonensis]